MKDVNFDCIIDRRNTNSLKHDFAKENNLPEGLVSMWIADMDFKAPPCVCQALQKSVEHGIFGYSDTKDDYYEIVSSWFERHFSWKPEKQWLVKTPGVVFALAMAVRALTKENEAVIIMPPVYYPFYNVINNNSRKLIESPLVFEDGKYHIDFEDFEKKIKENDVKLFILCSPHNPICRVWTMEELQKIGEICKKYGVYVVSDEIHCDFTWEGHEHINFIKACPELAEQSIICTAASKTFNVAGLQVSNIWIPSKEIRQAYEKEMAAAGVTLVNQLGIVATMAAYKDGDEWSRECKEYIKGNLDYVRSFLEENIPEVKLVEPEGTYFAWLDFTALGFNGDELVDFIVNKAKLWLDAGRIFGDIANQFQRIVLACPRQTIVKAMAQLKDAVDNR